MANTIHLSRRWKLALLALVISLAAAIMLAFILHRPRSLYWSLSVQSLLPGNPFAGDGWYVRSGCPLPPRTNLKLLENHGTSCSLDVKLREHMRFELARRLQEQFAAQCPRGWTCRRESSVLPEEYVRLLGYRPQADVLLESSVSAERIWIELEVSRADPVANHAKFGSAHLISPFPRTDCFVSMMSRDVVPGRANLAAHAIFMLRRLGLRAFQIALLPTIPGAEIKRLNQAPQQPVTLPSLGLEQVIDFTRGVGDYGGVRVHYATNPLEVMLNLAQWNRDIKDPRNHQAWGTRRVRYFVYSTRTGLFAPSKFCAYTVMPEPGACSSGLCSPGMEIPFYMQVDQQNSIFDGQKAWRNLVALGFSKRALRDLPSMVKTQFTEWLKAVEPAISAQADPEFLLVGGASAAT